MLRRRRGNMDLDPYILQRLSSRENTPPLSPRSRYVHSSAQQEPDPEVPIIIITPPTPGTSPRLAPNNWRSTRYRLRPPGNHNPRCNHEIRAWLTRVANDHSSCRIYRRNAVSGPSGPPRPGQSAASRIRGAMRLSRSSEQR
ncbi:hypothetical protein AC579_7099 [Pseudocercospora musae]|uniref:Uncharacterized protein n=1 Tax=Pseudocercospora musae TaxID=113226 RepID=A0A139INA0_9PEZI|nr:hypothetical protein AC579_7099 [Pseudocercospora musae]KXT16041.1 hypothetical protein AC579_7099 [Pseudocercospora musae]KXT16042.1 hypothetical protein AC579_7099 [Pseudocercospora musae]KXT16044.1 hypothetical protein AC579_7099 [Pseudocercospora musae]